MTSQIAERIALREAQSFFGRDEELAALEPLLDPDGPLLAFVHGVGGVGKSRLLDAFAERAGARGVDLLRLDGRAIEPTERGFLAALGDALGRATPTVAVVAAAISARGRPLLLVVDAYERLRLLDDWLRQRLIPALDERARVVLAGREPPLTAWALASGWQGLLRVVALGPLDDGAALAMLRQAGLDGAAAASANRIARGHPLALRLAAAAAHLGTDIAAAAGPRVLADLTRLYLADVPDPLSRRALQAAAVVRRVTRPLLAAMLPDLDPEELAARLAALPFVEPTLDGLMVDDTVRAAVAGELRATDPEAHRAYRLAAWRALRSELARAGRGSLWRYTADLLFLLEAPQIREVFFPRSSTPLVLEPARPDDWPAIAAICDRHSGPGAAAELAACWGAAGHAFRVVRGASGEVSGFYCALRDDDPAIAQLAADGPLALWRRHLARHPVGAQERALLLREMLGRDCGEGRSPEQAAMALDLKRSYLELRPWLRRVYLARRDPAAFEREMAGLGFRPIPGGALDAGGRQQSLLLDFGPGSVDGWLAGLVGAELEGPAPEGVSIDVEARELRLDGARVGLSPLEFELLRYLAERPGRAVPRGDLLEQVWGYSYDGGSNVVDVAVRALRRKLGAHAAAIETVTKVGYRFRAGQGQGTGGRW